MKNIITRTSFMLAGLLYVIYDLYTALNDGINWHDFVVPTIFLVIISVGFFRIFRSYQGLKYGVPIDDELSKKRLIYAYSNMFVPSMIIWFMAMLLVEEKLISYYLAAILALALCFGGLWSFIAYFKWRGIVDEE